MKHKTYFKYLRRARSARILFLPPCSISGFSLAKAPLSVSVQV
jgi:hypothetical protein